MEWSEPKSEDCPAAATQPFMRLRAILILSLSLVWLLAAGGGRAQESAPEYQLKAAFLVNFAKFVEWPPTAFAEATSPFVLGILGENPFGDGLKKDITINNRRLEVRQVDSAAATTNCHILFIVGTAEKPDIIKNLGKACVLTVGEMKDISESRSMINFVRQGNKFRFQINEAAAKEAHLKISSKLLSLAVR